MFCDISHAFSITVTFIVPANYRDLPPKSAKITQMPLKIHLITLVPSTHQNIAFLEVFVEVDVRLGQTERQNAVIVPA